MNIAFLFPRFSLGGQQPNSSVFDTNSANVGDGNDT